MEVIEKIPLIRLQYLITLTFSDFKSLNLFKSESKNDDDRRQNYNYLISYCQGLIKSKGEMKRAYTFTDPTPLEVGGRLYSGLSIQGVSSKIRGFLLNEVTTDIDMKNAHPVILRYLCKINNIFCPNLDFYVNNRDEVLSKFDEDGKTEFLKAVNSDKTNKKIKDKFFKEFDKECKTIQETITKLPEYKHIVNSVPSTKIYNWLGSAINRILCVYENKILQEMINCLIRKEIEICALMFDGLMVYGNYYDDDELLENLETVINNKFLGLNMKLSYKNHKTGYIEIPDNFEVGDKREIKMLEKSFENIADEFQKTHIKIINKGIFIKQLENDNIIMSERHLITSYKHLTYEKYDKDNNIKQMNFINDWTSNNPEQRVAEEVGVYPNEKLCPSNHFNMWRKFSMEMINDYEPKLAERDIILNHIKILCNNEESVYDYFIKWIAQMIQYPEMKSTCATLISKQGAGKGTLMRLFEKMLGNKKIFQTTTPSRDVFGEFNGQMANSFLVNLDELSKKDTKDSIGIIKGLITEPMLTINNKQISKFDIISYHRFIITTNNEEPITTDKDERRLFIIKSSDEKCGDKEYFSLLYEYLADVNVVKTCYEYFKSIPGVDKFDKLPLPCTAYHKELKEMSKSPIESWIYDFTIVNQNRDFIELKKETVLEQFVEWTIENKVDYNIDSLKLMVRLNRLNIPGIEKKKTNAVNLTRFNIPLMKKHLGIGCLL